jgi:hypothetical protein
MKYTSALISDARNKLGGDVFARNRAGLYVRVKVKPKNPKTTIQQANRASFSTYTKAWRSLTAAQILGWNTLAANSMLTDTLGNSFQPSGIQMYISLNRNLALMGFSSISSAPAKKPSFPTIITGPPGVGNSLSSEMAYYVAASTAALAVWPNVQLSATRALSTGVTFVAGSWYRNLGPAFGVSSGYLFWGPSGTFANGIIPTGKKCGLRVRIVDPSTGYASRPEVALTVVADL